MKIDWSVKQFADMYAIKKQQQIEIIQLMMEGLSDEEVAHYYKIEVFSAKNKIRTLLRKVNVDKKSVIMSEIYKIALGGAS